MNRTHLLTLLLVLVVGLCARTGVASAKPKVVVLGLEVLDKGSPKSSLDAARQVTEGLRAAGRSGGPFDMSDAQREFADEKVINGCESESRECLSKMATTLSANALMYGKVQLADGKKSFQVTVWLLSLEKNAIKSTTATISASSSAGDQVALGKKLYGDLTGGITPPPTPQPGSFALKLKAKSGTVYINGEARGQIQDGEYKSPQLAEGEYKVRVEAEGFKKWEDTIKVKSGQGNQLDVKLDEQAKDPIKPPPGDEEDKAGRGVIGGGTKDGDPFKLESRENTVSKGSSRTGWKIAAIGGAAVAAGAGVWWGLEYRNIKIEKERIPKGVSFGSFQFEPDCSDAAAEAELGDSGGTAREAWTSACKSSKNTFRAGILVGVGGVVALVGTYMGFIRSSEAPPSSVVHGRARKPRFALTPMVSPDGGGATFRLDF